MIRKILFGRFDIPNTITYLARYMKTRLHYHLKHFGDYESLNGKKENFSYCILCWDLQSRNCSAY